MVRLVVVPFFVKENCSQRSGRRPDTTHPGEAAGSQYLGRHTAMSLRFPGHVVGSVDVGGAHSRIVTCWTMSWPSSASRSNGYSPTAGMFCVGLAEELESLNLACPDSHGIAFQGEGIFSCSSSQIFFLRTRCNKCAEVGLVTSRVKLSL